MIRGEDGFHLFLEQASFKGLGFFFSLGPHISFKIDNMLVDFLAVYVHDRICYIWLLKSSHNVLEMSFP